MANKKQKFYKKSEIKQTMEDFFRKHIGEKQAVSKGEIFQAVYGNPNNFSDIQVVKMWRTIQHAMKDLRKTGNYFVVPIRNFNNWSYCIVTNELESAEYTQILKGISDGCIKNIKKCKSYIEAQKHKRL